MKGTSHYDGWMVEEEKSPCLPSLPGTYVLVLRFSKRLEISVGRLGVLSAQAGYYVYVGSALGPNGLASSGPMIRLSAARSPWNLARPPSENSLKKPSFPASFGPG